MSLEDALSTPSDDTPEMPTARRVGNRRIRETAPAFNEVTVELSVVLGRASMPIHQLLKMGRGAVIELGASVDDDPPTRLVTVGMDDDDVQVFFTLQHRPDGWHGVSSLTPDQAATWINFADYAARVAAAAVLCRSEILEIADDEGLLIDGDTLTLSNP